MLTVASCKHPVTFVLLLAPNSADTTEVGKFKKKLKTVKSVRQCRLLESLDQLYFAKIHSTFKAVKLETAQTG